MIHIRALKSSSKLHILFISYLGNISTKFPRMIVLNYADFFNVEMFVNPLILMPHIYLLFILISCLTLVIFLDILVHGVDLLQK
jgi:hypothetical protein